MDSVSIRVHQSVDEKLAVATPDGKSRKKKKKQKEHITHDISLDIQTTIIVEEDGDNNKTY